MSTGRPPIVRIDGLGHREVIVDEIKLGLAALGEQHLSRAAESEPECPAISSSIASLSRATITT